MAITALRVEIGNEPIQHTRQYTNEKTGEIRPAKGFQVAALHHGRRGVLEFRVDVPAEGPYKPGFYELAGLSFALNQYNQLTVTGSKELALIPVAAPVAALKAA